MTVVGKRVGVIALGLFVVTCSILSGCNGPESNVIVQSENDDRVYRYHQLENGLQVVLISDPGSQKAAASLDVAVGSADDPRDRAGLAHFLEHMLFLGTEKYPEPDDYQKFVSQQGGSHNAYTSPEHTNYFFDVKAEALPSALDRFAQFFIAPLFSPEYVSRERSAVHSEYRAKIRDSYRRERDVFREIASVEHPMSKFTVGNITTLADREGQSVRDDLLAFYDDYYSADRMTLAVLGRESIEELEQLVLPLFAQVPQREAAPHIEGNALFRKEQLPMRVHVQSQKQEYRLDMMYPVTSVKDRYREKPLQYLGHLLGHEGEGSLFAVLKARGWAESLAAGANASGLNQGWFEISMQLTEEGFQHQREIEDLVQAMIEKIKQQGVEKWRFEEQQQLSNIAFRFAEKGEAINTVSAVSSQMHSYPVVDILQGPYVFDRFDPALILEYLERMNRENRVVVVTSRDEQGERISKLYDTPYRIVPDSGASNVSDQLLAELMLPPANPFVPEDLSLKAASKESVPTKINAFTSGELWHMADQTYGVPRTNVRVRIKTPQVGESVESMVLSSMYASLVNDALNEYSYPALLAGLRFGFSSNSRGFDISLGGYSDRQQALLRRVVEMAQAGSFSSERFNNIKQEQLKAWKNVKELTPYRQLFRKMPAALASPYWEDADLIRALEAAEFSDFEAFAASLWQGSEIKVLVHGNTDAEQARQLADLVADHLKRKGKVSDVKAKVVKLDNGRLFHHRTSVEHSDVAAALYIQPKSDDLPSRATMALLQQSLKSSFFHELRTQQQLGYIVFVTGMKFKQVGGSLFVVQSPTADMDTVVSAINDYLAQAADGVEDFELHRGALIQRLLEPPKNLGEHTARFWGQLNARDFEFDDRQRMVEYLESLSEAEFNQQVSELLSDAGAVWFTASAETAAISGAQIIEDLQQFKSSAPSYIYP